MSLRAMASGWGFGPFGIGLLTLVTFCAGARPAVGQGFGIRLERGEIGVDGRGLHQVAGVAPGSVRSDYQQWLRLPVSGYLVHPRVLNYNVAVRPLFGQHVSSTAGQDARSRNMGFDAAVTAFRARRLTVSAQATRSSGSTLEEFGTRSDFDNEGFTSILFIRDRYFPTTISYSDRRVRDRFESPYTAQPLERDQQSEKLRAEVRNRKLTGVLERIDYRDLRGMGDYQALNGQLRHRVEWGKGSSLATGYNVYLREGSGEIRRKALSERLMIAHTREFNTAYSFNRQAWSRGLFSGTNLSYDATARYSPNVALETAFTAAGQNFKTGLGGGLTRFRLAPSLRFILDLPAEMRLITSGSVGVESLSRRLPSDLQIEVIEEPHPIDESRRFGLEELRADPSSIEIWDEARTLLLVESVDYRVVQTGPFTEVQILPGARVPEGEVVLVTYRYAAIGSADTDLLYVNYETTLRRKGFSLRHGRRQRSADLAGVSGAVSGSDDVDLWFGASFSGATRFGAASIEAVRRIRTSTAIEYRSDEVYGDLTAPSFGKVDMRFRASAARTTSADQVTSTASAGASLTWAAARRVRVTSGLDGWLWDRDGQNSETFLAGHAMLTWQFGQTNAVLSFDQLRRRNGLARTENRWSIRLVRQF